MRLRYNYRALPSILGYYDRQFYESNLIPMIDARVSHEAKLLRMMQTGRTLPFPRTTPDPLKPKPPPFGMYFMNVNGNNVRMQNKKSWRNETEGVKVCHGFLYIPHIFVE